METKNKINNIFLIGFSGSGKSKIGKTLSKVLNFTFIDTDRKIEQIKQKKIHEIIEEYGEKYFREFETEILQKIEYKKKDLVIATGGGVPTINENNIIMKSNGIIIWLDTSLKVIKSRLKGTNEIRPLLGKNINSTEVTEMYENRKKNYNIANIKIDTSEKNVNQIVEEIKDKLNE